MKRELRELTEFLETQVESGKLSEDVYIGACKRIKSVFDASEVPAREIAESVVISYALVMPMSLGGAPPDVNQFSIEFMHAAC